MNVGHYMTKKVITITPDVKLTRAIDIMEENNFHRIPVVENDQFVGLITEQVIAENSPSKVSSLSIYEMNYLYDKVRVKDLMLKNVVTTSSDVSIEAAAVLMADQNITVLPVLNEQYQVTGIITHKDIFKALIDLTGYQDEGTRVVVDLKEDRVGIITEISKALSEKEINVTHIFVNRPEDHVELTIQTTGPNAIQTKATIESLGYKVND